MYNASDIAEYIIERCKKNNRPISNLKLQKILYFVQAEFLVAKNEPCFKDTIEAWDFGPVVPNVYYIYRMFGGAEIPYIGRTNVKTLISKNDRKILNEIIDACSKYSASTLVEITHNQDPWIDAHKRGGYNNEITNDSLIDFFGKD